MQFEGKVAIVTGGGGAIGRAISLGLARQGTKVAVWDLALEQAQETTRQVQALGSQALALRGDVASAQDVERLVEETLAKFGRIDILINNAGICPHCPVVDMTEEEWDRVIAVNLKGVFLCSKAVTRGMMAQGGGKIVNITSGRGVTGMHGSAHYAASKGGINGFTRTLGMELAPYGINVNAMGPGITDTPLMRGAMSEEAIQTRAQAQPDKRLGQPEDVVGAVLFLCSEASQAMYGQIIYMKTP